MTGMTGDGGMDEERRGKGEALGWVVVVLNCVGCFVFGNTSPKSQVSSFTSGRASPNMR